MSFDFSPLGEVELAADSLSLNALVKLPGALTV